MWPQHGRSDKHMIDRFTRKLNCKQGPRCVEDPDWESDVSVEDGRISELSVERAPPGSALALSGPPTT